MHISKLSKRTVKYCILSHFYTPLSTVNQNSTPVHIFNTAGFVVCFHDCLDNGKTDAAASVFPGSCLIHLIELSQRLSRSSSGICCPVLNTVMRTWSLP